MGGVPCRGGGVRPYRGGVCEGSPPAYLDHRLDLVDVGMRPILSQSF